MAMLEPNHKPTILKNGRIIDGTGAAPFSGTIRIGSEGRIDSVGAADNAPEPPGARVIDLKGRTVLPGLMDLHIHFKMGTDDTWKVKASKVPVDLDMPLTMVGIRGFSRARLALRCGFTTVRDVGDTNNLAASLRASIGAGYVEGPRIFACGEAITMTGGTIDFFPDWLIRTDAVTRKADGAAEIRKAVRSVVKNGADWVKFIATGTMGPDAAPQEFTDEEIAVIVEEAHRRGKSVCAHACYAQGALAIVKAGVQSVEHGCELTDQIVDLMCEKRTFLVPTLSLFDSMVTFADEFQLPGAIVDIAKRKLDSHIQSFQLALKAGVPIANGSDIGSPACAHGRGARELTLLVRYGMSPMQAIQTATQMSARLLGSENDLGSLQVGKMADLIIVDGDPLEKIGILENPQAIAGVMKGGHFYFLQSTGSDEPAGRRLYI